MATNEPGSTRTTAAAVSRRRFLFLVGGALNVVAATLLAIPVIRYVFSSFRRNVASQSWIMLGALENFPENQTRLATYRNPIHPPLGWHDGGDSLLGAAPRRREISGFCDQLRASRMSGALVRRVLFVYVSLPRRRVL